MKILHTITIFLIVPIISVLVFMSMFMTEVFAQVQKGTNIESPQFLAIQHAESGTISEINSTSYVLELNDLANKTILFSDRPNRIVVTQTTQDFVGNWTSGEDSFQVDPPNAALVVLTEDQKDGVFEIELFNPLFDEDEKAIRYDFRVLGNVTSFPDLPTNLGKSVLIIDSSESKWPLQYSGD
jgi:hypothetical protein